IKITDFLKFFLVIVLFIFLSSLTLFFDFSALTIQRGLKIFVRSIAGTSCILFLIFTTPVVDIISFVRFRMLKDLIFLTYRAIYILLKVVEQMITAQTARFGYSNFRNTINSMKYLMYGAFSRSIKYSEESYMGLSSRNYNGTIEILKEYRLNLYILIPFVVEIVLIALEVFYVKA
ncbi:CbiQ family ECF transporter T component, partial [Thermosipho sp. (in: thermotogales)]|uniref:CbiQ family ECF transporter T component n=1 Tax=Thermosipho sp. (in: thermotogales) TaxID=1968895 RepID=UPI00257F5C21